MYTHTCTCGMVCTRVVVSQGWASAERPCAQRLSFATINDHASSGNNLRGSAFIARAPRDDPQDPAGEGVGLVGRAMCGRTNERRAGARVYLWRENRQRDDFRDPEQPSWRLVAGRIKRRRVAPGVRGCTRVPRNGNARRWKRERRR